MIDISSGDSLLDKYSVHLDDSDPTQIMYTLTINYVDETDASFGGFRCIADVLGYPPETWPFDQVVLEIIGNLTVECFLTYPDLHHPLFQMRGIFGLFSLWAVIDRFVFVILS